MHRWQRGPRASLRERWWKKSDLCEPEDHALGRSRGGFSTKIRLLCDGQGHPLHVALTAGQAHQTTVLEEVLECAQVPATEAGREARPMRLAGNKAYDAQWIRAYLSAEKIVAVIPRRGHKLRATADFDRKRYRHRNVIERLVGRLKECRPIFSRFEKTAVNYLGMVKLGMIRCYLKLFYPNEFSSTA